MLRAEGHEVYDFRNPRPGETGFSWADIDDHWPTWSARDYVKALQHPIAERGFATDWEAMQWADTCVLLLPSGRSAHIEAGYFVGAGKSLHIVLFGVVEPELMYRMADGVHVGMETLADALALPPFVAGATLLVDHARPGEESRTVRHPSSDALMSEFEGLKEGPVRPVRTAADREDDRGEGAM